MAVSLVNYHLRTADSAAVFVAVEQLITRRAYVSPADNGWVTVYEELSDSQDPAVLDQLAHDLSLNLHVPLLVFLVQDSNLFVYYLFDEEGCLLDEYNSAPDYFGQTTEEARQRFAGQPVLLLPHCQAGTTKADVEHVLRAGRTPLEGGFASTLTAEERLRQLSVLLGINEQRARLGFRLFQTTGSRALSDSNRFQVVQGRRRPPNPRTQVLPRIPPKT
jgi:hypothetical protein